MSSLTQPLFASTDSATIEAGIIDNYQTAAGRTTGPADPVRPIISSFTAEDVQIRNLINFAALQNLLPWASGTFLDGLVALLNVYRLPASSALVTLQFTLSAAQPGVVTIPAGTRAGVSGLYFATTVNVDVPAGTTVITAPAACTTAAAAGNGYLPGQITQMVDILPWMQSVTNTTTSSGGADTETDDALRARFLTALDAYSCAGPKNAYAYWAKTASPSIIDVAVMNPLEIGTSYTVHINTGPPASGFGAVGDYCIDSTAPSSATMLYGPKSVTTGWGSCYDLIGSRGLVLIYTLMAGGMLPTVDILDAVAEICSADNIRPLTDTVIATAPSTCTSTINVEYWIDPANAAQETDIQTAVQAAVAAYQTWQTTKLGRDIDPSQLTYLMKQAGAGRVQITSPNYAAVAANAVAQFSTVTITYGGLSS